MSETESLPPILTPHNEPNQGRSSTQTEAHSNRKTSPADRKLMRGLSNPPPPPPAGDTSHTTTLNSSQRTNAMTLPVQFQKRMESKMAAQKGQPFKRKAVSRLAHHLAAQCHGGLRRGPQQLHEGERRRRRHLAAELPPGKAKTRLLHRGDARADRTLLAGIDALLALRAAAEIQSERLLGGVIAPLSSLHQSSASQHQGAGSTSAPPGRAKIIH